MDEVKKSRKTSPIWNHFREVDSNKAMCLVCLAELSYRTSTTNLRKHIQKKHKNIKVGSAGYGFGGSSKNKKHGFDEAEEADEKYSESESDSWPGGNEHFKEEITLKINSPQEHDEQQQEQQPPGTILELNDNSCISSKEAQHPVSNTQPVTKHNIQQKTICYDKKLKAIAPSQKIAKREFQTIDEVSFNDTKIFGDFVASQLRRLSREKREKLQITIQRAILDTMEDTPDPMPYNFEEIHYVP